MPTAQAFPPPFRWPPADVVARPPRPFLWSRPWAGLFPVRAGAALSLYRCPPLRLWAYVSPVAIASGPAPPFIIVPCSRLWGLPGPVGYCAGLARAPGPPWFAGSPGIGRRAAPARSLAAQRPPRLAAGRSEVGYAPFRGRPPEILQSRGLPSPW